MALQQLRGTTSPGGTPMFSPGGTPTMTPGGTPNVTPGGTPSVSPGGTPNSRPMTPPADALLPVMTLNMVPNAPMQTTLPVVQPAPMQPMMNMTPTPPFQPTLPAQPDTPQVAAVRRGATEVSQPRDRLAQYRRQQSLFTRVPHAARYRTIQRGHSVGVTIHERSRWQVHQQVEGCCSGGYHWWDKCGDNCGAE